jgi:hypothetical protein
MTAVWLVRIGVVIAFVLGMGRVANAQAHVVIGGGFAIPGGPLGANRGLGPLARFSVGFGSPTSARMFRIDGEVAHMLGGGGPSPWSDASLTSFAAIANLISAWPGERAPYLVLGGGFQRLQVSGEPNPYGVTPGLRAGVGTRAPFRRSQLSFEIAAHLNVTDFAAGEYSFGYFFPIIAGLRF